MFMTIHRGSQPKIEYGILPCSQKRTYTRLKKQFPVLDSGGLKWPRSFLNAEVFGKWVGAFPSCIHSFIDCILEDTPPLVAAADGYKATVLLDAIHRSADTGDTVTIGNFA